MKKLIILISILVSIKFQLLAQPFPTQYFYVVQEDSTHYLLSDKALFKLYSHESSGDFFLTSYIEGNFTASTKVTTNDKHLFIVNNDTIYYFSNSDPWNLTLENIYIPGYPITSIHGFGPYFFIRTGDIYKLLKINNGTTTTVEDTLFLQPSNNYYVHLTHPFVILGCTVYKYVEGFDFYTVHNVSGCGRNTNTGLTGNKLVSYFFWFPPFPPMISILYINIIEEPAFPHFEYNNWGINVSQIHNLFGHLRVKKNLYFFVTDNIVLTKNASIAYIPFGSDLVNISDFYIFLLGDSVQYSKWNQGSTFYPLTWIDLTSVQREEEIISAFNLAQNYPNPFNPSTTIKYQLQEISFVTIKIYDVLGKEVATLVNEGKTAGNYEVEFNGAGLTSGIYFYTLTAGSIRETKKMIYLK